MADITITLTEQAAKNLHNMQTRCWDIQNRYGPTSPETLNAVLSFQRILRTILQWPGTVHAEDDLSLIINSSITIGIIWHAATINGQRDELLGEWSSHS